MWFADSFVFVVLSSSVIVMSPFCGIRRWEESGDVQVADFNINDLFREIIGIRVEFAIHAIYIFSEYSSAFWLVSMTNNARIVFET